MSNEQPHDPTITLRLELGRVTDQRNAYEAALRKEVLAVIKDALAETGRIKTDVANMADTIGCMAVELDDLRKENTRLKAEVDLWKLRSDNWQKLVQVTKAEVERLTKAIDLTIIDLDERHERQDLRAWEFAELLRKAKGVQS